MSLESEFYSAYLPQANRSNAAPETFGLRTRSLAWREVLARAASNGRTLNETVEAVLAGDMAGISRERLGRLAYICALQPLASHDQEFALIGLEYANQRGSTNPPRRHRRIQVELLLTMGRYSEAKALLDRDADLRSVHQNYLSADLVNPFSASPYADWSNWLPLINAGFDRYDLEPISPAGPEANAFDRLTVSGVSPGSISGKRVSIILTNYNTPYSALLTAVGSLTHQTWQNVEIIIVDDASDPEYRDYVRMVAGRDERIHAVFLDRNVGTYMARNIGLRRCTGAYVTGQDSDDWSHPRRIEHQVRALEARPNAPGTRVRKMSATSDLGLVNLGRQPFGESAPSLMLRSELVRKLNGFLRARKGADNELRRRVEAYVGAPVLELPAPLVIMRRGEASLSSADYGPGWQHPARAAYQSAYSLWHSVATKAELEAAPLSASPVPVPRRLASDSQEPASFDVVLCGDLREGSLHARNIGKEASVLANAGYSVGVVHLESPRWLSDSPAVPADPIRSILHSGEIRQTFFDEPDATRLLLFADPSYLQFLSNESVDLRAASVAILLGAPPRVKSLVKPTFIADECERSCQELFGVRPLWAKRNATADYVLGDARKRGRVATALVPQIQIAPESTRGRVVPGNRRPVIGRISSGLASEWPDSLNEVQNVYPASDDYDVRVRGGLSAIEEFTRAGLDTSNWLIYGEAEISTKMFLRTIDFFVYFDHPRNQDLDTHLLRMAIASGCVTILPARYEAIYGAAAVYSQPGGVLATIDDVWRNEERYWRQAVRGQRLIDNRYGQDAYVQGVTKMLQADEDGSP